MVYIEAQDKKLKFGIETNELQAGWFDRLKDRFDWSKITYQQNQQTKKAITYSFKAQIASHFFQYLKDIIS